MQRRILLNHDWKHWHQSLSSSVQGSSWYAFRCWKPLPRQSGLHHREQKAVTQVRGLGCKEGGSTAAQESTSENPLSNGCHGQKHCHGATGCPSVQLLGTFLRIFGEPVGVQMWCATLQSLPFAAQVVCCHKTTCSKESEHHFLPNTFCSFHSDRSIFIREPPDRLVMLCFWIILVNSGLVTCNDLRITARVPILDWSISQQQLHLSDLLTVNETVWHPARCHLADPKIDAQNFCSTPRSNP